MALPNYFADQMRAGEAGRADAVRRITGQALTADTPEARNALVQQATQADPTQGVALQKQLDQTADAAAAKAAGAANYVIQAVKTGNPAQIAGAYRNALPYLSRLAAEHGQTAPAEFSEDQLPGLHQLAAAGAIAGMGGDMKSLTEGADGTYWAIKNGQFQSTGIPLPPKYQLRDQPGLAPAMIDTRRNVVAPLGAGTPGMAAAPGTPAAAPAGAPPVESSGAPVVYDDPQAVPPAVKAAIAANPDGWGQVPDNAAVSLPPQPAASGPDPSLTAPRPAVSPAEAERLALAREANARAEESAQLARQTAEEARIARERGTAPQGMRFRADGSLEPIPGAGSQGSEDERKAAGWFHQASRALDNMREAMAADPNVDTPGFVETYSPVDEVANRSRSPERQRYVNAAASASEAILRAATGAGVNEQEARQKIAELTPQRGDSKAVRDQKFRGLEGYLGDLQTRAGRALQNTPPVVNPRSAGDSPVRIKGVDDYNRLPSGAVFITPDGRVKRKK